MLPGFGTAVAIFGTYVFLEEFYNKAFAPAPGAVRANAPKSSFEAGQQAAAMASSGSQN